MYQGIMNKRDDVVYKRFLPVQVTIPITAGALALVTYAFSRKNNFIYNLAIMRSHLKKSVPLNTLNNTSNKDKMLVYTHGNIVKTNSNNSKENSSIEDPLFGVSTAKNSLGLYRKYELYTHFGKKEHGWQNINSIQPEKIPQDLKQFQSQVLTNSDFTVNSHILSEPVLVELAEQNSTQLKISPSNIDSNYEEIRDNFEQIREKFKSLQNHQQREELESEKNWIEEQYKGHPFNYGTYQCKDILYEDNYIYICQNCNEKSEFDLRISFHQVQQIADVTLLLSKSNNSFQPFIVPSVYNQHLLVDITDTEGKNIKANIGIINFIQKGIIKHEDVINQIVQQNSKKTGKSAILYAFAVFILYQFICSEMGPVIDYNNWVDEKIKQLSKNAISKQANKYIVEDPQFNSIIAGTFSSITHLGINVLLAAGYSFTPYLFIGSFLTYWALSLNKKISLEKMIKEEIENLKIYQEHFSNSQLDDQCLNLFDKVDFEKS